MATRKPANSAKGSTSRSGSGEGATRKRTSGKKTVAKTASKKTSIPKVAVQKRKPSVRKAPAKRAKSAPRDPLLSTDRKLNPEALDDRCLRLIQGAALKAGSSAVIGTIVREVPMLGRLSPLLLGSLVGPDKPADIQRQLVLDILELYAIQLSEVEERAVVMLATAVGASAREVSQRSIDQIASRFGLDRLASGFARPILARLVPVASLATDGASTIAATYAIGRRAQALCRIGSGQARDLGDLLHGLTGIDQRRLIRWSGSAFKLAFAPFRGALNVVGKELF